MDDNVYDDLLVELECPICTNYMSAPIRQCATGHNVCEACRKKLPKCALCQGKFTESRNLTLEALAVKMRYPCINRPSGCMARLTYTERETHELRCALKGFKCPMEKCPWMGRLEDIAGHWASKKITSKPYGKSNICHTKIKAESYYVNMVNAYNKLFWFKCKLTKNKFYWAVQYVGKAAESENFYYEIEIFKPGRSKQKILISDYCQSIDLENCQLFQDGGCISINSETINKFVGADQLLIYYMRVNKVELTAEGGQGAATPIVVANKERTAKPRDRSKGPAAHGNKKPFHVKNQQKQKDEEFCLV